MPYRIAIFASGNGTNAQNIAEHFAQSEQARVVLVLTDVRQAGVVARMQPYGIDTFYVPSTVWRNDPDKITDFLKREKVDIVLLCGFMRRVDDSIVTAFRGRILNIHPSLLPKYGGQGMYGHHVHEAVIAAGESESGATVHHVSEVMDGGEILDSETVEITADDTPETLEAKVHEAEYRLYPRAVEKLIESLHTTRRTVETEEKWAETLGVNFDAAEADRRSAEAQTPPPIPTPSIPVPPVIRVDTPPMTPTPAQEPGCCLPPTEADNIATPEIPPMPRTYLIWSILCIILCCTVLGIVATIFSAMVSSRYYKGDYEGALRASEHAKTWILVSAVLGFVQLTISLPFYLISML